MTLEFENTPSAGIIVNTSITFKLKQIHYVYPQGETKELCFRLN